MLHGTRIRNIRAVGHFAIRKILLRFLQTLISGGIPYFPSRFSRPFGAWHISVHPSGVPATSSLWHLKQA
jgi:hypothetical protein